ncbi:MAG: hypothetical protein MJZ09_06425 [Bacteroidales bacterium]|nr:hypothetical protein [Bacteroidales bacterium]
MKHKQLVPTFFAQLFLWVMCVLSFQSCSYLIEEHEQPLTVNQAKHYYEETAYDLSLVEYLSPGTKSMVPSRYDNLILDWENAETDFRNGIATVVVEIKGCDELCATMQISVGDSKIAIEKGVSFKSFLEIQKNTASGTMSHFIVSTVGKSNCGPSVILDEKSGFNGIMMLSEENGRCFRVYMVSAGKYQRLHKRHDGYSVASEDVIKIGFSVSSHVRTKGGGGDGYSTGEDMDDYCYNCHSLTSFATGVCAHCGAEPEEIGGGEFYYFCPRCGRVEEYCICDPDDPNQPNVYCAFCGTEGCNGECQNGQGGDSGDGAGNSHSNIVHSGIGVFHTRRAGEMLLPNVRDNISTQIVNCCTIYSVNYISEILNNSISVEDMLLYCCAAFGVYPFIDALTWAQSESLFNHYLDIATNGTIIAALNNRNPVLGIIPIDGSDYHCVSIVGYNPDYSLIVMDTETGRLTDISSEAIVHYYIVTGVK